MRKNWRKPKESAEAVENVACLIEREAEKAPEEQPRVSLTSVVEVVTDKGYHSSETVLVVQQAQARSYISEPKRQRRKWAGKEAERRAVYANRRRVKGSYGKRLMKKRGELIERSFAHCYETGAMRRVYLRGSENILKRQLIHVGAFNLSLIFRQNLGAGTPRELANRQAQAIFFLLLFTISSAADAGASPASPGRFNSRVSMIDRSYARNGRRRISAGSATDS